MQIYKSLIGGMMLAGAFALSSCRSSQKITSVESRLIPIDNRWDYAPDSQAKALVESYKLTIDSIMRPVVGYSTVDMVVKRPECRLSNLIADVLRNSTMPYINRPADVALINIGGLRSNLNKGNITFGNIYEILPFENSLCILYLKGKHLKELANNIVWAGGEGVSNLRITANKEKQVLTAHIGGQPIDEEKVYTVATVDYLAEGNDKMAALLRAEKKECHPEATIRNIFLNYVCQQTKEGKKITAETEGRILLNQ